MSGRRYEETRRHRRRPVSERDRDAGSNRTQPQPARPSPYVRYVEGSPRGSQPTSSRPIVGSPPDRRPEPVLSTTPPDLAEQRTAPYGLSQFSPSLDETSEYLQRMNLGGPGNTGATIREQRRDPLHTRNATSTRSIRVPSSSLGQRQHWEAGPRLGTRTSSPTQPEGTYTSYPVPTTLSTSPRRTISPDTLPSLGRRNTVVNVSASSARARARLSSFHPAEESAPRGATEGQGGRDFSPPAPQHVSPRPHEPQPGSSRPRRSRQRLGSQNRLRSRPAVGSSSEVRGAPRSPADAQDNLSDDSPSSTVVNIGAREVMWQDPFLGSRPDVLSERFRRLDTPSIEVELDANGGKAYSFMAEDERPMECMHHAQDSSEAMTQWRSYETWRTFILRQDAAGRRTMVEEAHETSIIPLCRPVSHQSSTC